VAEDVYWAVEIDGQPAGPGVLAARGTDGHFTAMQVRDGRTRGLDFHLARLDRAQRELFGAGLDGGLVRDRIRHAMGWVGNASVRVYAYRDALVVTVRPPGETPAMPHAMRSVRYRRPMAHLKYLKGFAQGYYAQRPAPEGLREDLFVGDDGLISEGSITNVGFWRRGAVVWPAAPALAGIMMQVLRRQLAARGVPQADEPVRLADVPSFDAMFLCNSRGWAPVDRVDGTFVPVPRAAVQALADAYARAPRDLI
jgi:branched-subunit amino acid aminotransferase/4-amino-4-deoxychorismate lyase